MNGQFLKLCRCREVEDVEKSKQLKMAEHYEERIRTQRIEVDQLKQELSSCAATCRQLEQQQVRSASPAVWSSYRKAWKNLNPSLFRSAAETISKSWSCWCRSVNLLYVEKPHRGRSPSASRIGHKREILLLGHPFHRLRSLSSCSLQDKMQRGSAGDSLSRFQPH